MKNFSDLSDWHIDVSDPAKLSVGFPGQVTPTKDDEIFLDKLSTAILEEFSKNDDDKFSINVENLRYRVQHMMNKKFAVRAIGECPNFEVLNIPLPYRRLMLSKSSSSVGGLIIVCGTTGSGKTSTAAALLKETLNTTGGFSLTVEDPIEYIIRGFHGTGGYCEQMDATKLGYEAALTRSLRCFPSTGHSLLFFGEVRDKNAASELLKFAINGQVVITTLHSNDIPSAIQRMISLAGEDKNARYLLSQSLLLVIHQKMDHSGEQKKVMMTALDVDLTARSIIMNDESLNLGDLIRKTENRLKTDNPVRAVA